MTKEEILRRAVMENEGGDEREKKKECRKCNWQKWLVFQEIQ